MSSLRQGVLILSLLLGLVACAPQAGSTTALPPTADPTAEQFPSPTPQVEPTLVPVTPTPEVEFPGEGPWDVTFAAADGVTLHGRLFGRGTTALVLIPTYPGEQQGWYAFAEAAAQQGYMALALDLRGYGQSEGARSAPDAPLDLAAAIAYLQAHEVEQLVLIGAGQGGTAAIKLVAAGEASAAGLALISAPQAFDGLEVSEDDLAALALPTLWVGARNDLIQRAEDMAALAASTDRELWIYEGSSLHGTYILEGADSADLQRRLLDFAARVTGGP
jgi:dienelactone hydrolase